MEVVEEVGRGIGSSDPNAILLDCIEKGFQRYGQDMGRVVFWHLEHSPHSIPRSEIPVRLQEFVSELRAMFGTGLKSISRSLAIEIRVRTGNMVEISEEDLLLTLSRAKAHFQGSVEW